jgi:hypothetical protein
MGAWHGKRQEGEEIMSRLQLAIEQIVFARNYSLGLLEQTPQADWLRMPPGGISHVGWQVGHLAFAEYRLALFRIRGRLPQDDALYGQEFADLFGAKSTPHPDPARYPAPAEIRGVLDRVHAQVLQELPGLEEASLDQPVPHPHPYARTRFLAFLWCAHHEMMHAGQIGLLRRQLGYPPMW